MDAKRTTFRDRPCKKFYKYLKFEDGMKVISLGTLMFTRPIDFNDPFDCYPSLPEKGWDKVYKRLNTQFRLEHKAPKKLIDKNLRNMRRTGKDGVIHRMVSKNLAITCFSEDPLSVPMWAHYADEHEGCVIEFQSSDMIAKAIAQETPNMMFVLPFYVDYTDDRPPLYDKDGVIEGLNIAYSKSSQWRYEKEVRAFSLEEGIHNFSRRQITKVYMGVRMSDANKRAIKKAVLEMNKEAGSRCKTVELSMAFNSYKFVVLD